MYLKLRLVVVLLSLCLIVVVKGTDAPTEDYCRIDCGDYEINPFVYFCHNGVRVPCDASHCRVSRTEYSSKRCALYCGQVLQKLQELPRKNAALKMMQDELASKQQNLNVQYHIVAGLQTENSKLSNQTRFQKNTTIKNNNKITSQQKRVNDLENQNKAFMICVGIESAIIVVLIIILVFRGKLCGKPKDSGVDEEQPLVKLSEKQPDTKSKTNDESSADSAFGTTSSGSSQPTEDQQQKHKCDELIKPTDDNVKAPVVTSAANHFC
ncbi:uncharacterized protein LOC110443898 [Mizuhopecten yessoensis]|uniref:Uncharacterized protein n=1 Tax=Mizuhopecten yessoensis TaxID=6573 RepID=A0A210PDV7_MIZYE|nr:uncharacterized protein LOC110443898 [Mizuhopecten yessoensis]XP_021344029.1 uncharacterized protein LOC110443898 [Mizuhopecten yessoensis]XP_021344030.1 uncharacterized protein LOC110443898 [Mizuhopecten yessoensis]OWF34678.1 hypothetical protein KP79_PYT11447 [Mizuhopecten yessoensis]